MSRMNKKNLRRKLEYLQQKGYMSNEVHDIAELHIRSIAKIADDIDKEDKKIIESNEKKLEQSIEEKSVQIDYFDRLILNVTHQGSFKEFFKNSIVV